jgi:hypothetical protein
MLNSNNEIKNYSNSEIRGNLPNYQNSFAELKQVNSTSSIGINNSVGINSTSSVGINNSAGINSTSSVGINKSVGIDNTYNLHSDTGIVCNTHMSYPSSHYCYTYNNSSLPETRNTHRKSISHNSHVFDDSLNSGIYTSIKSTRHYISFYGVFHIICLIVAIVYWTKCESSGILSLIVAICCPYLYLISKFIQYLDGAKCIKVIKQIIPSKKK